MIKLSTKQIALTSVFAGFYYLFSFLPGIPVPVVNLKIQVEACLATVFGCILGPLLGAVATFIGVTVAWLLPPGNMSPTGLLFIPSPIINAAVSGFLIQRKWKEAAASLGVLIIAFLLTPPIQPISEYWNVGFWVVFDKLVALLLIGALIVIDKRGQRSANTIKVNQQHPKTSRSWLSPLMFTLSSLLIFGNNLLVAATGKVQKFKIGELAITFGNKQVITALGDLTYIWVVVGLLSIFASVMLLLRPEKRRGWIITILICSLASVFTGGGFIVGVILAVVNGIIAFFGDTVSFQVLSRLDVLRLFIIAFIGNEADNMWGSLIFAFPFVYTTIYQLDVDIVRGLFLLSPFAYPAIRLFQAVIATVIVTPLLRTLRAAKLIPSEMEIYTKSQS